MFVRRSRSWTLNVFSTLVLTDNCAGLIGIINVNFKYFFYYLMYIISSNLQTVREYKKIYPHVYKLIFTTQLLSEMNHTLHLVICT